MHLIPIGHAAQQLGLRASALRYYETQGLVTPARRPGGQRMYATTELRRLAFVKIAGQLGLPLTAAAAVLNAPSPQWRHTAREQLIELDSLIERAQAARGFIRAAIDCPADHPANECRVMIEALDQVLAGATLAEIAPQDTHTTP